MPTPFDTALTSRPRPRARGLRACWLPVFVLLGCGSNPPAPAAQGGGIVPPPHELTSDAATATGSDAAASMGPHPGEDGGQNEPSGPCVDAKLLWFEDFETSDYARWSSQGYNDAWGNRCQNTARSSEERRSGAHSQRSEVVCPYPNEGNVHRGYGGLQFDGDRVLPAYTNRGAGLDAPHGVVNTFWVYLDTDTVFENGRWLSLWTVNSACDWSDEVLTLGLEDASSYLASAHYWSGAGGTREYTAQAAALPRRAWTRITVYVNYYTGELHVWQNGQPSSHTTFDRSARTLCQWHWGLYASGDNDAIVLYEDDNALWKLGEPWTDFEREPYLGEHVAVCAP